MSKLFVLNRILFAAPAKEELDGPFYGGWEGVPHDEHEINTMWPLSFGEDGPLQVTAKYAGYSGHRFLAVQEFDHFLKKYGRRPPRLTTDNKSKSTGEPSPKPGKSATTTGFQRVKVKLGQDWLTLEAIGQSARTALKERNLSPPDEIKPVFDFFPGEKAFVRVMFGQGIGKRCWSVEFDREGEVLEVVTAITDG